MKPGWNSVYSKTCSSIINTAQKSKRTRGELPSSLYWFPWDTLSRFPSPHTMVTLQRLSWLYDFVSSAFIYERVSLEAATEHTARNVHSPRPLVWCIAFDASRNCWIYQQLLGNAAGVWMGGTEANNSVYTFQETGELGFVRVICLCPCHARLDFSIKRRVLSMMN